MHLCQEVFAILILWQARLSERTVTARAADSVSVLGHVFPLPGLAVPTGGTDSSGGLSDQLFSISVFYLDLKCRFLLPYAVVVPSPSARRGVPH